MNGERNVQFQTASVFFLSSFLIFLTYCSAKKQQKLCFMLPGHNTSTSLAALFHFYHHLFGRYTKPLAAYVYDS